MESRERLKKIFSGEKADRCGFWMGDPHKDTWPIYLRHFNSKDQETLRKSLKDDFRWHCPQWTSYRHPHGKPIWENSHVQANGLASSGFFADCEDPAEVEKFEWPNPDYLDFSETLGILKKTGPYYRASGFWCCFFHDVADFFGMENYFVKMYTHPEVVEAVTRKVCGFYLEANERFYEKAGREVDGFFFGNDFGTQLDLLISPESFDRFVMPWFRKFTEQGHSHGYQVILHSCGSIHKVIDRLIDSGVDALHPLQAKACGMEAEDLAAKYKGKISFMGGIDTQDLLVNGTPEDVRKDVRRVIGLIGPNLVVSPSHEALLSNVPPENVKAMSDTVMEILM